MSEHTPGPWRFEINPTTHSVKLISHAPLRPYVMGFKRYGMQSAQPTLRVDGRMTKASEISEPEEGREHHAHWHQLIDHPDANLIEAAPDLLEACKELLKQEWFVQDDDWYEAAQKAREAIAKAEGREAEAINE